MQDGKALQAEHHILGQNFAKALMLKNLLQKKENTRILCGYFHGEFQPRLMGALVMDH